MESFCKSEKIIFRLLLFFLVCFHSVYSQDTLQLREVLVKSYPLHHSGFTHTSSAVTISGTEIRLSEGESMTRLMNHQPGVRMEERSPGSYRFSIRGSLLRSPFGIRNVKFYVDDFPLTDGGGNTYLNLLDKDFFSQVEVIKGPDGSFFGANTGGCVLMESMNVSDTTMVRAHFSAASYKTFYTGADVNLQSEKYHSKVLLSCYSSDGYRANSEMNRINLITSQRFKYGKGNVFEIFAFASKLKYKTPGGLTISQAEKNPQQARPASGSSKSAEEQKAGVENTTCSGGLSNEFVFGDATDKVLLSYSATQFENPFITNYEVRDEKTFSLRNVFHDKIIISNKIFQWTLGLEGQQTHSDISNYGNRLGEKDTLQASDEIFSRQGFVFAGGSYPFFSKLIAEASVSMNFAALRFRSASGIAEFDERNFPGELMPRFALLYSVTEYANFRISASKGYSLPTLAELRPSTNIISPSLKAEKGWNYEFGVRLKNRSERIVISTSVFYFELKDAIVRRTDINDNEIFSNAGGTKQLGFEIATDFIVIKKQEQGFIRGISLDASYAFNRFKFSDYVTGGMDYSQKSVTGVPANTLSDILTIDFPLKITLQADHYYCDRLPLNDANTDYADRYNVFNATVRKMFQVKKTEFVLSVGAKNLSNQFYSSGNDLNAFGKRYYNPAPLRNYFVSVDVRF